MFGLQIYVFWRTDRKIIRNKNVRFGVPRDCAPHARMSLYVHARSEADAAPFVDHDFLARTRIAPHVLGRSHHREHAETRDEHLFVVRQSAFGDSEQRVHDLAHVVSGHCQLLRYRID